MLKIGLTGGIGAGKSTVAKIFEVLGIPLYYADERAKHLMQHDQALTAAIKDLLGDKAYNDAGELDRRWIASKVFDNDHLLTKLNYLVHPAVGLDGDRWHDEQEGVPFTLKEAALTYESGQYLTMDAVISVEAPLKLRLERVQKRDQIDATAVQARMRHQWPEDRRRMLADFIIENDGTQKLIPQVWSIYQSLLEELSSTT